MKYTLQDHIWYYNAKEKFPRTKDQLDLWIGPIQNYGYAFNYWVLKYNQTVLAWSTFFPEDDPSNMNRLMNIIFPD